jgi:catechol 2,3-dioxygenase-like lactoylglutathione lyase family enzyme
MLDHTGINVSNFEKSKEFYAQILAPLGYQLSSEFNNVMAGFGIDGEPDFWIMQGEVNTPRIHIAFRAQNRDVVREFYAAALEKWTGETMVCQVYALTTIPITMRLLF